jgi:hypothetical protein
MAGKRDLIRLTAASLMLSFTKFPTKFQCQQNPNTFHVVNAVTHMIDAAAQPICVSIAPVQIAVGEQYVSNQAAPRKIKPAG